MIDLKWNEAKKKIFLKKKNQKGRHKKTEFFDHHQKLSNFRQNFTNWSSAWVSRISWCKGHWFCSTYMAVRLSDICSKTVKKHKKCIFCLFWSICRTASRPYRLGEPHQCPLHHSILLTQGTIHFFFKKNFFASSSWKLVTNYVLEWMGLNFYDYDGLQPKTTPPKHISRQCSILHGNIENETDTETNIYYLFPRFHDSSTRITF